MDQNATNGDSSSHGEHDEMTRLSPADVETVTMEVTVDVADMGVESRKVLMELAGLYEDAFMEVVEKNRDYGFSFLQTGCKMASTDGYPLDNPVRVQTDGLLHRAGDKRERLIENVFGDGDSRVSDDPHVTAREAGNYWFFMSFVLNNPDLATSVGCQS